MARRRKPLTVLRFSESLTVGALADQAAVGTAFDDAVDQEMYFISMDVTASFTDHTQQEGPLHIGVAHNDYTDAEIAEWWVATNGWNTSDQVAYREIRRRLCRIIGTFAGTDITEVLNNGVKIRVPLKFKVADGQTLKLFVINDSQAALTTGTIAKIQGRIYCKSI